LPDDPSLERPDDPKDTPAEGRAGLVASIAFVVHALPAEPFTGFDPDQMPVPVDDPPIQPAGWAFAIWGVIYLWLLASAGFGLFKRDTTPAGTRCAGRSSSAWRSGAALDPWRCAPVMATC
jgi:hypothetical protein